MSFNETNGEICDKQGNFLFSSNGIWIANNANDTMQNGSGLNPSAFTTEWDDPAEGLTVPQANLVIPFSTDSNRYYIFHQTIDDYPNGTYCSFHLYYSIIDMSGDSGRGAVIDKNHILLNDSLISGGLTACKHANGRDWWLIAHQFKSAPSNIYKNVSNLYFKFLITPSGIQVPDTQSIGAEREPEAWQCTFSPDGKYFANYDVEFGLDIFDFDRCTGNFFLRTHADVDDSAFAGGVSFSPNSQVLYVSSGYGVDQFDMNASDIATSKTTILLWDSTSTTFYLSQLAPDGKIYINTASSDSTMHVINNPNALGLSCNACRDCILLPALNSWTIANDPNYFLGADSGSVCDSLPTSVSSYSVSSSKLEVFPNPVVNEEITFTYNVSSERGIIFIYNTEGKEVAQYSLPQWSSVQHLKLPKLASGVYLARLKQGDAVSNIKFIKD